MDVASNRSLRSTGPIKKDRNYLPHSIFNVREGCIRPSGRFRINLKNRPTWASFIAAMIKPLVFGCGQWRMGGSKHLCVTHCDPFAIPLKRITISLKKSNLFPENFKQCIDNIFLGFLIYTS